MATTVIRYVDPNSSGGDGTTNGLSGATAAYASLSAWNTARARDLVSADEIERVICSSDDAGSTHAADTTAVTIDGWTTDATRYIQVEAASSHGGKWNDNIYRLTPTVNGPSIGLNEAYVRVLGLQVSNITPAGNDRNVIVVGSSASGGSIILSKCIIKGHNHASYTQVGVQLEYATSYVFNCLLYNFRALASVIPLSIWGTSWIYSTTVIGGANCIARNSGTVTAKNVYCGGSLSGDYSGTITQTTCASSDTTAAGTALDSIAVNTTNFTNVTASSEDFHLPAGSALIDVGTDTSGEGAPLNFTDDIDGETRTGTWDIGADEYVAGGTAFTREITDSLGIY